MKATGFILLFGLVLIWQSGQAQNQPGDTGKVAPETVIVTGSYDPRLMDFPKKNFTPVVEQSEITRTDMKYSVFAQPMKIGFQTTPIKAPKMSGEAFTELYGNYLRAGFGSGKTPYAELFVGTKRDKKKSYGLRMKHFSTAGEIDNYAFPGNSNNEIELSGARMRSKNTIEAKLFWHRDVLHYYGFKPAEILDSLEKDDYRQRYNDAGLSAAWYSTHSDSSHLNYRAAIDYHAFWDVHNASENSISLHGFINKKVNWLKFSKQQTAGVRVEAVQYFNKRAYTSFNAGVAEISPFYRFETGPIAIEASPSMYFETDSTASVYLMPAVRMELNLVPGNLRAFGGIGGNLTYQSYRVLAGENPFIHRFIHTDYSKTTRHLYGGIRGNIANAFNYTIQAVQRDVENCPLFVNDTLTYMGNWMGVVYDAKVRWFRGEFNSDLSLGKKWKMLMLVAYNQSSAVDEAEVWNMPQWEGMLGLSYNLADKILVGTRVYYTGKRFARQQTSAGFISVPLDAFVDANLNLEYRYSKVLSAFLSFHNIAAQQYMLWNQYPGYRFRMMGGVTYSF